MADKPQAADPNVVHNPDGTVYSIAGIVIGPADEDDQTAKLTPVEQATLNRAKMAAIRLDFRKRTLRRKGVQNV